MPIRTTRPHRHAIAATLRRFSLFTFHLSLVTFALAALLAGPASAAPTTRHSGASWVLENTALRVEIDAPAGRYQVLDKRSKYLWRGPAGDAVRAQQIVLPRAGAAPKIDGDLSEWAQAGTAIALPTGAGGLGARLRLQWDAAGLSLAVAVTDPKLVPPAPDDAKWWEKDSVEFWLNETQYAVRFGPWGANVWSSAGTPAGASAAFRPTPDGYCVEAMLPARLLGGATAKGPGGQFRFALGVNSADGADGRKAQVYFPSTWRHSNSDTFATAVMGDESGQVPTTKPDTRPVLTPVAGARKQVAAAFEGTVRTGGKELPVSYTFRLDGDRPDLLITMAADEAAPVDRFRLLHPLVLDRPGSEILAAPYMSGIGVPTDDLSWQGRE